MISAEQLRKIQTEKREKVQDEKVEQQAKLREAFVKACDEFQQRVMDEIGQALNFVAGSTKFLKNYIILDHEAIMKECGGYKASTLMYGFWNKDSKKFDGKVFADYEIQPPFQRVAEECSKTGYTLEDISDSKRSLRIMLKLSWGPSEFKPKPKTDRKFKPKNEIVDRRQERRRVHEDIKTTLEPAVPSNEEERTKEWGAEEKTE